MKKMLAFSLVLSIGFILGALSLAFCLQARAGGSPPTANANGDTNGDGSIDISDAVYLLTFLFSGGPGIAEVQCPSAPPKGCLLATGQQTCFGSAGFIDCNLEKARGQDGYYKLGCPLDGRFVDNGDGTISDACTGLMWTKKRVDVDEDGELTSLDAKPWLEACQIAHDMAYLGHNDWRVPNVNELLSIVNFGANNSGLGHRAYALFQIEGSIEPGTWTSTTAASGYAFSHVLSSGGGSCDCCAVTVVDVKGAHPFLAVRGP